ncbi:obscurin-like isoform X7 [Branchiostoma floridae]|uniref:Obscurin-like isoform X7 n=1 Tax=Branchiostoma floridae TaxID=7739 RepID=A0A9J7KRF7_BRAFL|nr:obscurin-like isoform X7 [Branchiostoma floridae]
MAGATNLQWVLSALFPNPRVYMDVNQRGLICPVCNDQFKSPLTLPCLHSVCRKCAEEILVSRENERNVTSGRYTPVSEPRSVLKCPACKKEVPLDSRGLDGLTENFILRNIIDSMQEAKEYSELDDDLGVQCDVCQEEPPNLATKTCVKCELCYCEECLNLTHPPGRPLTGHQLIAPTRDPKSNIVRCQEHNEIISLYCEDDDTVVCPTCHARSHKGHKVIPTDEKYRQMKAALKDSVKSLVNVNSTYVQHIGKLRSVCDGIQGHFDKQEGSVKKEFSDVKALVQKKEKDMLTTIEKERREKVEVRQQQIDHYRRTLENTTAAVSFAQEALRERGQASFLQKANMIDKKVKSALDSAPPIQDTELTEMPDNLFEANLDLADIASVINNKASVSKAPPPPEIRKSQCIVGESSISIRWHVPDPSVYKDYQVQYSTLPDVVRSTSRTSERLAVLESLSPGTTYTCTVRARDKDGTIHCSKPVDFKTKEPDPNAPARVTSFLTDLEVRGLADAKFTCAITRPASEVQAKWSCDDNVITPSSKYEMTHEGKTLTLIVHNVQSSDTGEYACEVDDSKTCAQLSIKEPALPAINIQKCEVEDNAIIVRWNVPEDEKYDNFQLLYSKSFQSVGNRFLESSIFKTVNNIKETECKVLGLSPDSHYRFYVRSTTEWGLSQRSSGVLLRTLKKVPPPSFYRQLISLSVSEKDSARFSCELSRPVPVKWLKNDKPIPEDPRFKVEVDRRRHVLTITDIKADDAGEYSCDTGSTRSSASLKVKAEPATFIKPLKDVEVVRHGKATLECEVSRDDAKVRWLKSGMDVLQNTKHDLKQNGCLHQLIISDVRLDDASEYACEVVQGNGSPTGVRSTAKLKIRAINHSVPGTPEIIADESTVTPNSVTLVWKDPDPSNGDVYHVLYAKFYGQSSGRYKTISGVKERQCTVSNLEPDTKYKFYVRAVDKAGISRGVVIATSPPDDGGVQFQKILRDEEVFSKETATFECQLSAPNAEVKWLRNSVQIHSSGKYKIEEDGNRMTHRLIVNNCGKEDVAEYTCQCGINKTTASLRVKESQGPEILSDKCKIESDSITLYWTTPTLSTFRTYQVLYATSFGPNVTDNYDYQTLSDIRTTFCRIPALQADTTYKFYVRGVTKDGISRPSRGVELTTQPEGRRSRLRTRARSEENLSRALSPSAQKKRLSFNFKDFISDSAPGLTRKDPGINMSDVLRNYVSPFFKKGLVSTMVKIGSEVRFECSIGGFPNPMVIWEKDGREIRQDYRHKLIRESEELFTLVIFRARAEDSGTYEVVATNEAGERRSSATLGVTELESVNEVGSSPVPPPRRRGRISAPIFGDVREKVGQFERGAKRYESFRERRQPTPPEVTESNLRRSQSTEMLSHHQRSKVSAPLSWLKKQLRSSLADDELKDDKEERESKPSKARSFFGSLRKTHSTSRF